MSNPNDQIESLLPLYFEGQLNEEQIKAVEDWVNESEEHRSIAADMAAIYHSTDQLFVLQHVDTEAAWKKMDGKIRKDRFKVLLRKIERVAAVLLVPVLMVSLYQFYSSTHSATEPLVSYTTNPGMTGTITLPDGSMVTLNSNSRITYPQEFSSKNRYVSLQGEAYFSVTKDAHHPFIVSTPCQASVKVYGTHFNVDAYPEDKQVTATLEEGSIALRYLTGSNQWKEAKIEPGEQIIYSASNRNIKVLGAEVDVCTSWKDGKLIFRNTSVKDVLRSLSKRFDVTFDVRNPQVYHNSFTGTLDRQRLDRILEILSISSNMHFKYESADDTSQKQQIIQVY